MSAHDNSLFSVLFFNLHTRRIIAMFGSELLRFFFSGDNYLKPYVISEPEVTVMERSDEDECLILASDGLWDTVQNETACRVVQMCLKAEKLPSPPGSPGRDVAADGSDKACFDASILLTKLAMARHSSDNVSVVVVDLRREKRPQQQQ